MNNSSIKTIIIVLLLVFIANFTFADQPLDEAGCKTKDFSAPFGEIRHQGNIGWCYANVAADMLTYRYHKELNGERVSAGYVALSYNELMRNNPNDDAGHVIPAIMVSQHYGVCLGGVEDEMFIRGPYQSLKEKIDNLVLLKTYYDKQLKNLNWQAQFGEHLNKYLHSDSLLNQLTLAEIKEVLAVSSKRNFPRKVADRICEKHRRKLKLSFNVSYDFFAFAGIKNLFKKGTMDVIGEGKNELIKKIQTQINFNNPVAVSYKTGIFYSTSEKQSSGLHVSIIAGRRWNNETNSCEFLLRNSWGKNCHFYTNPELKGKCDPKTGNLWLPSHILKRTINDISYFRDYQ